MRVYLQNRLVTNVTLRTLDYHTTKGTVTIHTTDQYIINTYFFDSSDRLTVVETYWDGVPSADIYGRILSKYSRGGELISKEYQ